MVQEILYNVYKNKLKVNLSYLRDMLLFQEASITTWIARGADPKKLNIGIALYGHSFKLEDKSNVAIGSKALRPGPGGHYTRTPGVLGYLEVGNQQVID